MKAWADRSQDERRSSVAKGIETRRRNREYKVSCLSEAAASAQGLKYEIKELEVRLAALKVMVAASDVAATITGCALLREEEIVELAKPWERNTGVYFLVKGRRVVYVGQSVSVYSRIGQHKSKDFDLFAFVPCDVTALDKIESLYIHVLRPPLNGDCAHGAKNAPISLTELIGVTSNEEVNR